MAPTSNAAILAARLAFGFGTKIAPSAYCEGGTVCAVTATVHEYVLADASVF